MAWPGVAGHGRASSRLGVAWRGKARLGLELIDYIVLPAEISDIYAVARHLRDGDRLEVTSLGLDPATALRKSFKHAVWRRVAVINGEIAAVFGMGGNMLSNVGYPWLLTTPAVEKLPVSFVKEGRKQAMEMLSMRRRLEGHVAADYRQACRFLEALGFTLGEPEEIGPLKAKFRKFTMER